ncbi:MAG TPA: Nif11-like leader peptide family RiPP precursor [Aggregatilineales bacterium]|nr:Nif11-like leader peptide family RiPP precursor [Aggregatilineales bacterium]
MSAQNVIAFVNKVNGDRSLQTRVAGLADGIGSLVQFAAESGFTFTADEWNAVVEASAETLSEDDLGQVSGGLVPAVQIPSFTGGVFLRFR